MIDTLKNTVNNIYVASDHNGTAAKNLIFDVIADKYDRSKFHDLGPFSYDGKVNYVDYAIDLCYEINSSNKFGVLICGTGTGMCIAANKFRGIRAALVTDTVTARLAREHNNANVLVLGQWRTPLADMEEIIKVFITTPFGESRHIERVAKLNSLGEEQ